MSREMKIWAALVLTVTVHYAVVFGNVAAFVVLPFCTPWYIALPLCSFLVLQMSTPVDCPLTKLENSLRGQLGKPRIRGFVGHYILKPARTWLGRRHPECRIAHGRGGA